MYNLLFAIMILSNSTKNQRDVVSSFFHSFSSKITHFLGLLSIAIYSGEGSVGLLAGVFGIDALVGIAILATSFNEAETQ